MGAMATPHQSQTNEPAACSRVSSDDHARCIRDQPTYAIGTGATGTVATGTTFTTPTAPKAPITGDDTGSNFVPNHGTCLVQCYTGISKTNKFTMLRCIVVLGVG